MAEVMGWESWRGTPAMLAQPNPALTTLYCTVLYCTVLYCTVLYCTVLHRSQHSLA